METSLIIGLFFLFGLAIYNLDKLISYFFPSKKIAQQKRSDLSAKDLIQEVNNSDFLNKFSKDIEEAGPTINAYLDFLASEPGSRLIRFEEDFPYSKEKVKKAILIQAACGLVNVKDQEPEKRLLVYENLFMELASFIPKEDAKEYKEFVRYLENCRKYEEVEEFIKNENIEEFVKGISGSLFKIDFREWAGEIIERRKMLRNEWNLGLKEYAIKFVMANRLSQDT